MVPELYKAHQGKFLLSSKESKGDTNNLSEKQKETIDAVLNYYGDKNAQWLSDLTHAEAPWHHARKGLSANERGDKEISWASLSEFYSSIPSEEKNS